MLLPKANPAAKGEMFFWEEAFPTQNKIGCPILNALFAFWGGIARILIRLVAGHGFSRAERLRS
jgi:hypothetical protein